MFRITERIKADILLLIVSIIWGSAFVAQRVAAQRIGFYLFNGARFLVAAIFLLMLMKFRIDMKRRPIMLSALTGLVLFGASALQQAGISATTASNAGFITSLYVVFVPLLAVIVWNHKVALANWIAAAVAVFGAYLLSTGGNLQQFSPGDILELAGAAAWGMHVLLIGQGVKQMDPLPFTFWQLFFASIPNIILAFVFDMGTLDGLFELNWTVLYTGIFSIGLGYFLQALGQRHAPAVDATLILCLESVFAGLGGWLLLNEELTLTQLIGCVIILSASIFVQVKNLDVKEFPSAL